MKKIEEQKKQEQKKQEQKKEENTPAADVDMSNGEATPETEKKEFNLNMEVD